MCFSRSTQKRAATDEEIQLDYQSYITILIMN